MRTEPNELARGPIRVPIAEDRALLRASFAALMGAEPDLTVVGQAADGVEVVALSAGVRPDVVVMDIQMPGLTGIEATRRICADPALADTRVLVLTMFEIEEYVLGALRAGASGLPSPFAEIEPEYDRSRRRGRAEGKEGEAAGREGVPGRGRPARGRGPLGDCGARGGAARDGDPGEAGDAAPRTIASPMPEHHYSARPASGIAISNQAGSWMSWQVRVVLLSWIRTLSGDSIPRTDPRCGATRCAVRTLYRRAMILCPSRRRTWFPAPTSSTWPFRFASSAASPNGRRVAA